MAEIYSIDHYYHKEEDNQKAEARKKNNKL